jgi:glycosyltransferase involved in cell wall biosynthesis
MARRERRQAALSDAVMGCSTSVLNDAVSRWKLNPPLTGVMPNLIDISHVVKLAQGDPPCLPEGRRVLFFGRLEAIKGVQFLGPAMRSVLAERPDVHLILAGDDRGWHGRRMSECVRECAGERVAYLGELPPERLMPLILACDVIALPSLWEAFPFTVLEAIALGRPVVTTSGHGPDDFITHGQEGFLVPREDARALGDAIGRLLDNSELAASLGSAAARRAEQYSPQNGAALLTGKLEEVASLSA